MKRWYKQLICRGVLCLLTGLLLMGCSKTYKEHKETETILTPGGGCAGGLEYEAHYVEISGSFEPVLTNSPQTVIVSDKTELDEQKWWKRTRECFQYQPQYAELVEKYEEKWFEDHSLIFVLFRCASSTPKHEVTAVKKETEEIQIQISRYVEYNRDVEYDEVPMDEVEANWNIILEIKKEDLFSVNHIMTDIYKEVR